MDLKALYASMLRTRYFEEEVGRLASEGLVYGTYHLAIGQEAVSSGTAAALHDGDWIVPTHRCHGYNAARGSDLRRMFSEILGSRDGLCGGLGGSMHMTDRSTWNLGSSAVVGSGIGLGFSSADFTKSGAFVVLVACKIIGSIVEHVFGEFLAHESLGEGFFIGIDIVDVGLDATGGNGIHRSEVVGVFARDADFDFFDDLVFNFGLDGDAIDARPRHIDGETIVDGRIRRALEARGSDGSGIGSGFEVVFIEIIRNFVNDVRVDGITLDKMGDRSGENGDFSSGICLCGVSDDGVDGSEIAFFGIDSHGFQGIGDGIVGFAEDELLHVSLEIGEVIGVIVFSITRSPNGREVVDIFARGTDLKGKSFVVAVEGHLDGDTVLISPTFILDPAIGDISHDIRMDAVGEIVSVFVFDIQSRKRIAENIGGDIRLFGRRGGRSRGSARLDEIRRGTERATGKGREREEGNN